MKSQRIFILLALSFLSCKKQSTEPDSPKEFFPLNVGNVWVYATSYYDTSGVIRAATLDTITIANTVTFFYEQAYRFSLFIGLPYYWLNRSDGVYIYDPREVPSPGEPPRQWLIFKYPVVKGNKWSIAPVQWVTGSWYALSNDSVIVVNSTTYHCCVYELKYNDIGRAYVVFVAPGTGIVQLEYYDVFSPRKYYQRTLSNYHLNPK